MSTPAPDNTERTAPADTEPLCPAQPPELHSTVSQLRESLSLLEVELVKLRELVLTKLTRRDPAQQLKDQVSQIKNEYKASLRELRAEVKELQQDREIVRRELTGIVQRRPEPARRTPRYLRPQQGQHQRDPPSPAQQTQAWPGTPPHPASPAAGPAQLSHGSQSASRDCQHCGRYATSSTSSALGS
ncbi:hypothetical protein EOD39_1939 [Acipenser ruthenus]|uniref:Uncharacterized protein n=1 Tax=Acipenser ruthenus TaxID=7906 RepID=A0A444U5K2_ACIRT|nr:hypothetical protein EOD39_1939 [Acipenser ruthenus]